MSNDPWSLAGSFFSIVVKRAAVIQSFSGAVGSFERVHQPARKNGALFLLARMSLEDVETALAQLNEEGLVPGVDVAAAELHRGPILPCPGIVFTSSGDPLFPTWTVNVDPHFVEPPRSAESARPAPASAPPTPTVPKDEGRRPPTRVVFGSGPVHWLYHDDDDEDCEE